MHNPHKVSKDGETFRQMRQSRFDHWDGQTTIYNDRLIAIAGSTTMEVEMHHRARWNKMKPIPE